MRGAGMQYIEASVIGIRSAVITVKRRATPLRFVLIPMVHVAEPDFYGEVAALAGECALIVAEGVPSRYFPMRALGRYGSPFGLANLEQADEHDDRWERLASGRLGRAIQGQINVRDSRLVKALGAIHQERQNEPIEIAVVFGAAHIPAVVDYLTEKLGYYVANARWLTVANAPD